MDAKLNSVIKDGKRDDACGNKPRFDDSITTASESSVIPDKSTAAHSGTLAQVSHLQGSTEDTELSSYDFAENAFTDKTMETSTKSSSHSNPKGKVTRAASISGSNSVKTGQPQPLCALLSPSTEASTVYKATRPLTSIHKSQKSLKTTSVCTKPSNVEVLLACLFCHPLDCLLAAVSGCNKCVWSLCSSLCGCEAAALPPLQHLTHRCELCGSLGVRCFLCDPCYDCLHATECLDLAMEMSQMLYH